MLNCMAEKQTQWMETKKNDKGEEKRWHPYEGERESLLGLRNRSPAIA